MKMIILADEAFYESVYENLSPAFMVIKIKVAEEL